MPYPSLQCIVSMGEASQLDDSESHGVCEGWDACKGLSTGLPDHLMVIDAERHQQRCPEVFMQQGMQLLT